MLAYDGRVVFIRKKDGKTEIVFEKIYKIGFDFERRIFENFLYTIEYFFLENAYYL